MAKSIATNYHVLILFVFFAVSGRSAISKVLPQYNIIIIKNDSISGVNRKNKKNVCLCSTREKKRFCGVIFKTTKNYTAIKFINSTFEEIVAHRFERLNLTSKRSCRRDRKSIKKKEVVAQMDGLSFERFLKKIDFSVVSNLELYKYTDESNLQDVKSEYLFLNLKPKVEYNSADSRKSLKIETKTNISSTSNELKAVINEAYYSYLFNGSEIKIGKLIESWGIIELHNPVDILNQRTFNKGFLVEEKLPVDALKIDSLNEHAHIEFYLLPNFNPREFPESSYRGQSFIPIDKEVHFSTEKVSFKNPDYSLRLSRSLKALDLTISYFNGTNREPTLIPIFEEKTDPVLVPHYSHLEQVGMEASTSYSSFVLNFEGILRDEQESKSVAYTLGVENTLSNAIQSGKDIILLAELSKDYLKNRQSNYLEKDVLTGIQVNWNNNAETSLKSGIIQDLVYSSKISFIEFKTNISPNQIFGLELRMLQPEKEDQRLLPLEKDSYIKTSFTIHF